MIYQQYAYSYPHKLAYRTLEKPRHLDDVWKAHKQTNLFAYLHIPFCEMRCGFCNLFTIAHPKDGVGKYLSALKREAQTYRTHLSNTKFEAYAIGGGTPTYLNTNQLEDMLLTFKDILGVDTNKKFGSIETSPKSISLEKIKLIEAFGITRASIGIQSWIEEETKALGRPQPPEIAEKAVTSLANSDIPEINIDLIYGIKNQTPTSWKYSLEHTLAFQPAEIYLYPLYTRPLTGLDKPNTTHKEDNRLQLYRQARELLLTQDYQQVSMRCFRHKKATVAVSEYNAAFDGMIGIGAGARSYTPTLHYSSHYAVSRKAILSIIESYSAKEMNDFQYINYGIELNRDEQIRRFLIKSLIDGGVLNGKAFQSHFGQSILDIEIIHHLFKNNWLTEEGNIIRLSEKGMEMEDVIGPFLFSNQVNELMDQFQLL